ncbi:MAG: hypothetical protein NUV67_01645 [archaeon]|nr:hypothetical protein [archaeon]
MDIGVVAKNALTKWHDPKMWRYIFSHIVLTILMYVVFGALLLLVFGDLANQIVSAAAALPPGGSFSEAQLTQFAGLLLQNVIVFVLLIIPLSLLFLFSLGFVVTLMQVRALQIVGFETAPFPFGKFLRYIVLLIYNQLLAWTSWYNGKWRIYFFVLLFLGFSAFVVAFFVPLVSLALILGVILLSLPYFFIVIYNAIRLYLAPTIFLHKDQGITQTTKEAWALTAGRVGDIFITAFVAGLAVVLVSIAFWFVQAIGRVGIEALTSNVLAGIVVGGVISILYTPIIYSMGAFILPSIYAQLKGIGATSMAGPNASAPEPAGSVRQTQIAIAPEPKPFMPALVVVPSRPDPKKVLEDLQKSKPISEQSFLARREGRQVDKVVALLKDDAATFSSSELGAALRKQGYSEEVISRVLKRLGK